MRSLKERGDGYVVMRETTVYRGDAAFDGLRMAAMAVVD
jgi:hypothetical protein